MPYCILLPHAAFFLPYTVTNNPLHHHSRPMTILPTLHTVEHDRKLNYPQAIICIHRMVQTPNDRDRVGSPFPMRAKLPA
jgi:hypothetical protein